MTKKQQKSTKYKNILFGISITTFSVLGNIALFLFFDYHIISSSHVHSLFVPITATCIFNSIVIVLVVTHYSARLKLQTRKIEEHNRILAEAEKETMRANLLRAVSHDLRTPLTGIIGNSIAYLESDETLTEDKKRDIVQNIYEDSTWLINMVENLLTITRINGNDLTINTSEESVEEVVAEALQKMQKRHETCVIHASVPTDFLLIRMDAMLIEQVIINLLENALFHSLSDAPIEFLVEDHPDYVSFTVRDRGVGIPKDRLSHLFDGKDYTTSTSDVQKGMGIGLVICQTIITAHHGTIAGKNYEDGAEFTFSLPKKETV